MNEENQPTKKLKKSFNQSESGIEPLKFTQYQFPHKKIKLQEPPIENSVNKKEEEEEEEKSRSCIEIVLDDRCEQFSEDEKNEVQQQKQFSNQISDMLQLNESNLANEFKILQQRAEAQRGLNKAHSLFKDFEGAFNQYNKEEQNYFQQIQKKLSEFKSSSSQKYQQQQQTSQFPSQQQQQHGKKLQQQVASQQFSQQMQQQQSKGQTSSSIQPNNQTQQKRDPQQFTQQHISKKDIEVLASKHHLIPNRTIEKKEQNESETDKLIRQMNLLLEKAQNHQIGLIFQKEFVSVHPSFHSSIQVILKRIVEALGGKFHSKLDDMVTLYVIDNIGQKPKSSKFFVQYVLLKDVIISLQLNRKSNFKMLSE